MRTLAIPNQITSNIRPLDQIFQCNRNTYFLPDLRACATKTVDAVVLLFPAPFIWYKTIVETYMHVMCYSCYSYFIYIFII